MILTFSMAILGVTNHWTTNHWTGLNWTGILKFVFMHCGMQLLQIIILTSSNFRVPDSQGCIPIVAQYVQAISYIVTPVRRQWRLSWLLE